MRFNHDESNFPSDQIHNNLRDIPMTGYGAFDPIPQSQSIVNNMMYYQGIYYLVCDSKLYYDVIIVILKPFSRFKPNSHLSNIYRQKHRTLTFH